MRLDERFSILFKILLPLMILVLLRASPLPQPVVDDLRRAQLARDSGQHQAAADAFRRVVERQPWRQDLWEQIGRSAYAAGDLEAAAAALSQAAELNVLSPDGRFLLAETFYQQGNFTAAEAAWRAVLAGEPSAPAFERLASMQSDQGDYPAAVAILRDWRAALPQDARAAYLLGLHLSVLAPEEALPHLLEAARLDPAYSGKVQTLRRGLGQAAAADYPAYGLVMIGRALGSIGQWALAEEGFRRAVELDADYAEAWAFLGEARTHTGGSGRPELERARALNPRSVVVNALYALSLRRQGKYQEALEYLQAVARQEPREPFWLMEIGSTLVEQGDLIAARAYFEQAAELAPENTRYWQALAQFSVTYNVDIREVGLPAARQAVILAPDDPAALDIMGWALVSLGDWKTGERFLQQALESDSGYAPAILHLGQLYLQRQEAEDAFFYLKQAAGQEQDAPTAEIAGRLLRQYFGEDR